MNFKIVIGVLLIVLSGCVSTNKNIVTEQKTPLTADKKALRNNFLLFLLNKFLEATDSNDRGSSMISIGQFNPIEGIFFPLKNRYILFNPLPKDLKPTYTDVIYS